MKKIAIVASSLGRNGISSVIMNYCKNFNLNNYKITIFAGSPIDKQHKTDCDNLGIEVIELPARKPTTIKYYMTLFKKMKKNYFDIVHVHGNSTTMAIDLFIGKIRKVKTRIAHCHNTKKSRLTSNKFLKFIFDKICTDRFACGDLAGKILYEDKNFYIMRNGVDTLKYRYDETVRNEVRNNLNVSDKIVLGHIGRFNTQKNHQFLLDVFEKVALENDNYVLLLIGTGPDFDVIKNRIDNSKYKDRIIVYGETNEPEKMYLAMDIFVFPSLYEGLPLTLVEAQISGLQCIISDTITDETMIGNRVKKLPIINSDLWKDEILYTKISNDRSKFYDSNIENINKFDIKECVIELEEKYKSLV